MSRRFPTLTTFVAMLVGAAVVALVRGDWVDGFFVSMGYAIAGLVVAAVRWIGRMGDRHRAFDSPFRSER